MERVEKVSTRQAEARATKAHSRFPCDTPLDIYFPVVFVGTLWAPRGSA